jgi:hypothetical protein
MLLFGYSHTVLYAEKIIYFMVENLVIGEQLWDGTGKTQLMTVHDVTAEGVAVEFTWAGKVKGTGKAKGVNGSISFTGRKLASPSGGGSGMTTGNGIFFTATDMIAIKSTGYGNPKWEKTKSLEIWTFSTASKTLSWLNDVVAIVTQEGDPAWKEFKLAVNEWK